MAYRPAASALLDVVASVVAIGVVLTCCIRFHSVGFDLRNVFAITGAAFFLAGFARGASSGGIGWKAARLSLGGLLGAAALILNNGPHQLAIPAGLMGMGYLVSVGGIQAQRALKADWRRSAVISGMTVGIAAAVSFLVVPSLSTYSAFDREDREAPPFTLADGQRQISSNDLRGHVTVLAFWASWCLPCIEELPQVQYVYREFQGDSRVALYAVDTGWGNETSEKGLKFFERRHLELPVAFDRGEAAKAFGVDAIPAMVLIDANSRVRYIHRGYDLSENLQAGLSQRIRELLAESAKSR